MASKVIVMGPGAEPTFQVFVMHTTDEECAAAGTVNADGDCTACGVTGGEPCPCGGVRFHRPGCESLTPTDNAQA